MEVVAPPPGYNLVNIPFADMQAAMAAYNHYMAVYRDLELALILRGVPVEMNDRFPVEHLDPAEAVQFQQALEQWTEALEMIRAHAGVDIGDIRLTINRNQDGLVVGVQVYRPPADGALIHMVAHTDEPATTTALPQESSSLRPGQIFGITVGSVAAAAVLAAAVLMWIRRRRRQSRKMSPSSNLV